MNDAVVGFRVKSGWSVAVLVSVAPSEPALLDVRRVELSDPAVPGSMQPFHAGLKLPNDKGPGEVARLVQVVERFAERSLRVLLEEYKEMGGRLVGAGVVVGSLVDPSTITNDHIRAHAEEGRLFRSVVLAAARGIGLQAAVYLEKNLYAEASATLRRSVPQLKKDLIAMGREVEEGWRAEEKAAALAALIAVQ